MAVYAVAQLTIHDRERYDRYVGSFMGILDAHGGRVLAAQDGPDVVEGRWPHDRIVLLAFADRGAFDRWATSPEYEAIAEDRRAATDGVVLVMQGLS
jgi:uncharacterized protein (DUF1330 family)